ncbi:MAG: Fic family protein [Nanoarchaeota archaeon]
MRIIQRKKGKKRYFYLQHSFRKGGKVVTKEMYLGKRIPKNIDRIKQVLEGEAKKSIHSRLEKIKSNFQKEWEKYPTSIKNKEIEQIAVAFTYNTNAIEGSTITLEEAREIIEDKIAPNKPIREIKETEAHYRIFLDTLKKKGKISNELLLRWHKGIFEETKSDIAGKYRRYLVTIAGYIAPDWRNIKKLINLLIKFINRERIKINPVELAAIAHYRFEKIHPFGDGNGRIGRLMMNHILWHNGYPMMIIEYKKRRTYYKALQKDEKGFVNYFLKKYLAVHKKRFNNK